MATGPRGRAVRDAQHDHSSLELLTDPFLQRPEPGRTEVAWFTEFATDRHHVLVGEGVADMTHPEIRAVLERGAGPDVTVVHADTIQLSRVAEDPDSKLPADRRPAAGIAARTIYRHHAEISIPPGGSVLYRVVSSRSDACVASETFCARGPLVAGAPAVIMLTSDHQLLANVAANIEFAARTISNELGPIDAVFMPGDFVNVPDRASEWFDDQRGSAFFPVMQGRGSGPASDGKTYRGAPILQQVPLFPAVGNHEVQGRRAGHTSLSESFGNAVPREVAESAYVAIGDEINPTGDPTLKSEWVENNSFSLTTYEEIFSPPRSEPGGKRYYATTLGDIRLISLFATRVWRSDEAQPEPGARESVTRYHESRDTLADPLCRGHGAFVFEDLTVGSTQYLWLQRELESPEFRDAKYTVVMLHESPHGLGENIMPAFTPPQQVDEYDEHGALVGVRYDYPGACNTLLRDVVPLLERAGVDLVYSGHNHLWNRFVSPAGVNYLEASNTGNSFGAYSAVSGRCRPVPPPPCDAGNAVAQGDPGGLDPVVPTAEPLRDTGGRSLPYVADTDFVVFQALHAGTGCVTSWYVDLSGATPEPVKFDEFRLR